MGDGLAGAERLVVFEPDHGDDDDVRRGQPTVHKAFDEALSLRADDGDALYGRAAYYRAIAVDRHDDGALKLARADLARAMRANRADKWASMALAELDALDVTKK